MRPLPTTDDPIPGSAVHPNRDPDSMKEAPGAWWLWSLLNSNQKWPVYK